MANTGLAGEYPECPNYPLGDSEEKGKASSSSPSGQKDLSLSDRARENKKKRLD